MKSGNGQIVDAELANQSARFALDKVYLIRTCRNFCSVSTYVVYVSLS